ELSRMTPRAWSSLETGRERLASSAQAPRESGAASVRADARGMSEALRPPSLPVFATAAPPRAGDFARNSMLVFPRDLPVSPHASGLVLVQAASKFSTRLEIVRSMAYPAGFSCETLLRRSRGKNVDEPLGGTLSPIVALSGKGELVLGPLVGQE